MVTASKFKGKNISKIFLVQFSKSLLQPSINQIKDDV